MGARGHRLHVRLLFPMKRTKKSAALTAALSERRRQIRGTLRPRTKNTSAKIKLTTNKIQAMFAEIPAMPEKPSTPATRATIRKISA
jgi:hypothetical protein